jgi:calcineurin-like phosphoesterase family protein
MSKIFLIGDVHIGLGFPNKYDNWKKTHIEYFDKFLIPYLEKNVSKEDIIVQLGDLFDNRTVIPIDLLNFGMDVVEKISKIAPLHILVGNHDCWHKSSSEINTIRAFRWIPNVFIYDQCKKIEFFGKKILMMPYFDKKTEQIKNIQQNKDCHYLFCHSDLNGAKMHLTSVAHKNNDKIDIEEFNNFKKVYSGHLHIRQSTKNFTFVGSIFEMDRNDLGNEKGIYIVDTIDGSEEFIPNEVSPKFKKVWVKNEEDILGLDKISTRDYIDLKISNSLLINNRKFRRKLEMILETGNFASVEYLDDIVSESAEIKSVVDEVTDEELRNGVVPSIQLEFGEIIKEYINNQKYNSDKIKGGILDEFEKIIDVYNQNFKHIEN